MSLDTLRLVVISQPLGVVIGTAWLSFALGYLAGDVCSYLRVRRALRGAP